MCYLRVSVHKAFFLSTSVFFELFSMRRECLQQQAAAQRKSAVPSVFFPSAPSFLCGRPERLECFKVENLSTFQENADDVTSTFSLSTRALHPSAFCPKKTLCGHSPWVWFSLLKIWLSFLNKTLSIWDVNSRSKCDQLIFAFLSCGNSFVFSSFLPFSLSRTSGYGLLTRQWIRCWVVEVRGHRRGWQDCLAQPPTPSQERDGLKTPDTPEAGWQDEFTAG